MAYTISMSRYLTATSAWETAVNIETAFNVSSDQSKLIYKQMEGLSTKGKPRIYSETFADSDTAKVYLTNYREQLTLKLTLVFVGDSRRTVLDNFYNYVKGYKLRFWDTIRRRRAEMYLSDAVSISEDKVLGGTPYIEAEFTFTTYSGETEEVSSITATS